MLASDPSGRIEAIWSEIPPQTSTGEPITHEAESMFVYILRGQIELTLGAEVLVMEEGASVTFAGNVPHAWANTTSSPAQFLSVLTPAGITHGAEFRSRTRDGDH